MDDAKGCTFLLDSVVTQLDYFGAKIKEPKSLMVNLKCCQKTWMLSSSRINVTDFAANKEQAIFSRAEHLRQVLEKLGMEIAVSYEGSTLGRATLYFTDEFVNKISPTMSDEIHEETVELLRRTDVVGTITVRIRLIRKCDMPDDEDNKNDPVSCAGLAETINPPDVMFLVGDPDPFLEIPTKPCSELPEEEGDVRLQLDLDRYKSAQNQRVDFPHDDKPCPKEKPSLRQLKQVTQQYSRIIDSVTHQIKLRELESIPVDPPEKNQHLTAKTLPRERSIPVPLGSLEEHGIKPIRFCPVCLYQMSWLPTYASCPRCNTKPKPVMEGHLGEVPTVDQIMSEQLVKPKSPLGAEDFCYHPCEDMLRKKRAEEECAISSCTCTKYRKCAHCRIRRLCEDFCQTEVKKKTPLPEPRSNEDFCVVRDIGNKDRPYLTRVFSEMQDLYKLHDSNALRKRCASSMQRKSGGEEKRRVPLCALGTNTRPKATSHKRCLPPENFVSRRHGWNWNKSDEARKHGWRPGAILRSSCQVMRFFLMRHQENLCQKICAEQAEQERLNKQVIGICQRHGLQPPHYCRTKLAGENPVEAFPFCGQRPFGNASAGFSQKKQCYSQEVPMCYSKILINPVEDAARVTKGAEGRKRGILVERII